MDTKMQCCPTCGSPLAGDAFNWDGEARVFVANGVAVRFTKTESWIIDALWSARRRGGIPDLAALTDAAYARDIHGGPGCISTVSVILVRIREKMKPTGYTVPLSRGRPKANFQIIKASEAA